MNQITNLNSSDICSPQEKEYDMILKRLVANYIEQPSPKTASELQAILILTLAPIWVGDIIPGGGRNSMRFILFPERLVSIPSDCFPSRIILSFIHEPLTSCNGVKNTGRILFGYRDILDKRPISYLYFTPSSYTPSDMTCIDVQKPLVVTDYTGIIINNLIYDEVTKILYYKRYADGQLLKFKINVVTNLEFQNRIPTQHEASLNPVIDYTYIIQPYAQFSSATSGLHGLYWGPFSFYVLQQIVQVINDEDIINARKLFMNYYSSIPNSESFVAERMFGDMTGEDIVANMTNTIENLGVIITQAMKQITGAQSLISSIKFECYQNGSRKIIIDFKVIRKSLIIAIDCQSDSSRLIQVVDSINDGIVTI